MFVPTSRAPHIVKIASLDVVAAMAAPLLAKLIRDADARSAS